MRTKQWPESLLWLFSVWVLVAPNARAFYNPSAGRWLSRDPIGERGGPNVFHFVHNDPLASVDYLGQYELKGRHFDPRGNIGGATVMSPRMKVTDVSIGSARAFGGAPGSPCCCRLVSATWSANITIYLESDPNALVYKVGAGDQLLQHEIVHATADEKLANAAFPFAIAYLQTHCMQRWLSFLPWSRESCMQAQQMEADNVAAWIKSQADNNLATWAHNFIGAYATNFRPQGIPEFYGALDNWLVAMFDPSLKPYKFW
jgi:hypothetical protein